MKLEQFEQVLEVAKTGTFSQAARNLYMSQPNLSLSIKQLEEELGCSLFVRTSEGVVPTEDGKILMEHMFMIENKYQALKDYSQGKIPKRLSLRVAMGNLNRAVPLLIKITKKYYGSPIHFSFLTEDNIQIIIEKVATCQADFGIIGIMSPYIKYSLTLLHNLHIEYHQMSIHPIYAVVGPENDYYSVDHPITIEDLKTQTLATYGSATEDPYSAIFDATQKRLEIHGRVIVNNSYLLYQLVENSAVMGLISTNKDSFTQKEHWTKLRLIEIVDFPITTEVGWIKLRRIPLSDIAAELIEEMIPMF